MNWLPNSLFGRLFLFIISFMMVNFILLRMVYIVLVAEPGGQQIAYFTESLATVIKEVDALGTRESNRQFAESLQKRTGIKLIWNTDQQWSKPPNLPYYRALEKTLTETWKDSLTSRFQSEPNSVFWLLHSAAPQFSIGLPLLDHMAIWKYLVLGGLFVIIFSMISAYFAARYLKTSLHDLEEGANLIGLDKSGQIITPSGPNEVRNVALAMNTMRKSLERMIKKQEFLLAGISHDLRTPLTRIRVATRLIGADEKGYIDGINSDIEEMDAVLHRFIKLVQLNIKESEPWEIGDITPLIQDLAAKYQQSKINLSLSLSNLPVVRFKPMTLQRYLYNLINNSMKHGGGKVTISTRVNGHLVELSVADQGPGFPLLTEELIVFSDLNKDQEHGNGLGLRIVQIIANEHEAELMARNKPEGGAEVILKLKVCVEVA